MFPSTTVISQIKEKAREAHKYVTNNNQLDSGYLQIHNIAPSKRTDYLATVRNYLYMLS